MYHTILAASLASIQYTFYKHYRPFPVQQANISPDIVLCSLVKFSLD